MRGVIARIDRRSRLGCYRRASLLACRFDPFATGKTRDGRIRWRTRPLIALTGATGFIGQYLLRELPKRGYRLRVLLRRPSTVPLESASAVIGDLARPQNMSAGAGRRRRGDPLGRDRARDVRRAGGRLSGCSTPRPRSGSRRRRSAPACGVSCSCPRSARNAARSRTRSRPKACEPQPIDAYGRSKLAAEQGLAALDLDWVALRPVLVYGAGVKGNMAALVRLARSRLPLPFGGLTARRSLLALDNLVAGDRLRAGGAVAAAAAAGRRRSGAVDAARNGRRHPAWPRPPAGPRAGAVGDGRGGVPPRRPRGSLSAARGRAGGRSGGAASSSAGPRRSPRRKAWRR